MIHSSVVHAAASREQEYLAGWQRARAELDNYRRRVAQEQDEKQMRARQEVIMPLLELADTFEMAIRHLPAELEDNSWAQGVTHVGRQLEQFLRELGVVRVDTVGCQFDPRHHEAVLSAKRKKAESGLVIEVIKPGYKMGDVVIRPAKVKVSA